MYFIKTFILSIILLGLGFSLPAQNQVQRTPKVKHIGPEEYGYESQNYGALQTSNGFMYFSNLSGVLEYDNAHWHLSRINGIPRMDIDCYGNIYVGGFNEIGYLQDTGQYKVYQSLLNLDHDEIGQIANVVALCGEVFFATDTALFRAKNKRLSIFTTHSQGLRIFKAGGMMYVNLIDKGFYKYNDGYLRAEEDMSIIKNSPLTSVTAYRDKLIITTKNGIGMHALGKRGLVRYKTLIDPELKRSQITCIENYEDSYLLIGTVLNGLFVIDHQGRLVYHINKSHGLSDNRVTDIFVDRDKQLWVSTFNGISYVEISAPFTYYSGCESINASILAVQKYQGKIYYGTNQGLFYLDSITSTGNYPAEATISRKMGVHARIKALQVIEDQFFVCSENGLFLIKDNSIELLLDGAFETVFPSRFYHDLYYFGTKTGLLIAEKSGESFDFLGYVNSLSAGIRTIAEDDKGAIWLGTDNAGIFRLDFESPGSLYPISMHIKKGFGLPLNYDWIDVYNTRSGIMFSTYNGVYRTNEDFTFYPDTKLGFDFKNENRWLFPVVQDSKGNLWFSSGYKDKYIKETGVAIYKKDNNDYVFWMKPFRYIYDQTIESICVEPDNNAWFGSINGLIYFDTNKARANREILPCVLRMVAVESDTLVYSRTNIDRSSKQVAPVFDYSQNNFRFEYAAPYFTSDDQIEYQSKLLGLQNVWTEWNNETYKEFTNLSEGEYIFMVRAKNIFGEISPVSSFKFQIRPPVYRSFYAIIAYISIIFSTILFLVKRKEYKHAREKYSLEEVIATRTEDLLKQKEQTEKLVHRILPQKTVEEIKSKGKATSRNYELATVLFSDIQGFTKIAAETKPEQLINLLDTIFNSFDKIIEKYDIEKIKTIGDAYMCAGGIPKESSTNPVEVVLAALEMQKTVKDLNQKINATFQLRVGIHTGPVVAGVVGTQKIAYDIWGDTVNIASRMETAGKEGEVNISFDTYSHIKDLFACSYRGKNPVKYKGDLDMYFVDSIKPELSKDKDRILPNHDFIVNLQLIRLQDLQRQIFDQLEKDLPKNLYYHNLKHTVNVYYQTETLARSEDVKEEDLLLLKTAALFHDIGFLSTYDNHEEKGVEFMQKTLPSYYYTNDQIESVARLIMVTKPPQNPKSLFEEIICDADLDYLGRPDFIPTSQNLFRELFERNKIDTIEQWNKMQIRFMEKHRYFTKTGRRLREPEKQNRLAELKKMI